MSNGTPQNEQNHRNDESGLDKGTGDPGDDRAYMMDEPPARVEPRERQATGDQGSEEEGARDQNG